MLQTALLIIAFALAAIDYLAILIWVLPRWVGSEGRRWLWVLTGMEIALGLLYLATRQAASPFWRWLFDFNQEVALPTMFSSIQLLAIAVLAAGIGLRARRQSMRSAYWWLLAAVFVYLALDEYLRIQVMFGPWWVILYAAGGSALALGTLAACWLWDRAATSIFVMILAGLVLIGGAGIGIDNLGRVLCAPGLLGDACAPVLRSEELVEMIGMTLVLVALVEQTSRTVEVEGLPAVRRTVAVAALLWGLWLGSHIWPIPAIEAASAAPVDVGYMDGAVSLIGYRLTPEVLTTGQPMIVTLYWRAESLLPPDGYIAFRVIGDPDGEIVAQIREPLSALLGSDVRYPSAGWIPGVVTRQRVTLTLAEGLDASRSYALIMRATRRDADTSITHSDREMLAHDIIVLATLSAARDAPAAGQPLP